MPSGFLIKQAQLFEGDAGEFAQFRAKDGKRNMAASFPAADGIGVDAKQLRKGGLGPSMLSALAFQNLMKGLR
jgi:hypothetical protein